MNLPLVELGKICLKMHQGINTAADKVDYSSNGYYILQSKHITRGFINYDDARCVNVDLYDKYKDKYRPKVGDILFCNIGTIGSNLVVRENKDFLIAWNLFLLRPDILSIDSNYLHYFLSSLESKSYFNQFLTGGTVKFINKKHLSSIKIPLPPLEEQRRVAAILDKADAVRRKRQEAIALTEELLRSAFMEMFDTSVAKSWEMATVEQLLASKTGAICTGPFGSQLLHSEFTSRGIAVLGIDNVVQNQFRWVQLRFISEKKYEQLKRYTVRPGDVLISIMGTCGRCAIVPDDCPKAINTKHLCCITLNRNKCYPEFLQSYFLIHPQASNYLKKNAKGAIMEGLNMSIIKDLPVPLVPIELQKQYVNLQHQIIRSKVSAIDSRHEADNLFNSLLQRAFRGEL